MNSALPTRDTGPDPILKDGDLVEFRRVRQPETSPSLPTVEAQQRALNPYALVLISSSISLILGLGLASYALWVDPSQAQIRQLEAQNQALSAQLEAISRCLGGG